jgi:hypothetical protein
MYWRKEVGAGSQRKAWALLTHLIVALVVKNRIGFCVLWVHQPAMDEVDMEQVKNGQLWSELKGIRSAEAWVHIQAGQKPGEAVHQAGHSRLAVDHFLGAQATGVLVQEQHRQHLQRANDSPTPLHKIGKGMR